MKLATVSTILNSKIALEEKHELMHGGATERLLRGTIILKLSIKQGRTHILARRLIEISDMQSIWVKRNTEENTFHICFYTKFDGSAEAYEAIEYKVKKEVGIENMNGFDLSSDVNFTLAH